MMCEVELPEPLARQLLAAASACNLTVPQFLRLAAAEKIARLEHSQWLASRAYPADRADTAEDRSLQDRED